MGTWHAVEAIDEALEDTKDMLLPFDLSTWTKLAVIAVLTGGIGGSNFFMPGGGSDYDTNTQTGIDGTNTVGDMDAMTTGAFAGSPGFGMAAVGFLVITSAAVVLLMLYISSVFEFIYYRSLLDKEVKIIEFFSANKGRGLSYFGFRVVFGLAALASLALLIGGSIINPLLIIPAVLLGIPLLMLLSVFSTLIHDFSLVEMLKEEKGIVEAVKDVLSEARLEWKQFGFYVLIKFFIGAAIGIFTMFFGIFSLLIFGIPFVVLGIAANAIFEPLIVLVAIAGVLAWLATIVYVVIVPAKTFTYFYALKVYSRLFE